MFALYAGKQFKMKQHDYWNQAAGTKTFTTPFHGDVKWIRGLFMPFDIKIMEQITFTTMNGHKSNGFFLPGAAL